jgi:hypothetical protein
MNAKTPLVRDLFNIKPSETTSMAYRNLYAPVSRRAAQAKAVCEEMWREFHDLADPQFRERFPFEFHQRWFEMYLGVSLRRAGLNVSAPKPGPDFRVLLESGPVYIEAVAPTGGHPLHADHVGEPDYLDADGNPQATQVPHARITLRIADAFRRKADIFDGYLQDGYIAAVDPCIVAINLHDIPHAWADAQEYWFRAFYGVGDRFLVLDGTGRATTSGRAHRDVLARAGGALEDVAPLLNSDRATVAGVLGSAADAGNVPNPAGDDMLLLPHALARAPYPVGLVKRGAEIILKPTDIDHQWDVETVDYGAHQTAGPIAFYVDIDGARYDGEWTVAGRELSISIEGRRSVFPIQGADRPEELAREYGAGIVSAMRSQRR